MNKQDVATELNCSTRQVEKYASEDRLGTIEYVRGKRGREAKYDAEAVARLKAELETKSQEIIGTAPQSHALQRAANPQTIEALGQAIADALRSALTQGDGQPAQPSIADLSHKLMLTEREAAAYSGLSLADIERARGALNAIRTGAGWRVNREEVERYVKKL